MNLKNSKENSEQECNNPSLFNGINHKINSKTKNIIVLNNNNDNNSNNMNYNNNNNENTYAIKENNNNSYSNHDSQMQFKLPSTFSNSLYPQFNSNINYYHEFWRMYLQNEVLISQMKEYVVQTKEIQAKINNLEELCHELELSRLNNEKKDAKKKNRRTANEIEKNHMCPYEGCNKLYGSDVSLNLHIKLKHNGGNKTEREKLARSIFMAQINGEAIPDVGLNLPPGFLQNITAHKFLKDRESEKIGKATNKDSTSKSVLSTSEKDLKSVEDYEKSEIESDENWIDKTNASKYNIEQTNTI